MSGLQMTITSDPVSCHVLLVTTYLFTRRFSGSTFVPRILSENHQVPHILRLGIVTPADVEKLFKMSVSCLPKLELGADISAATMTT